VTDSVHTPDLPDFEGLLRQALSPVEPPEDLAIRLEMTLTTLTDLAADELDAWEIGAMRDPRNWTSIARPVAAVAIGGAAGAALVVLRVRAGRKHRRAGASGTLDYAEQTVKAVADEARKLLDR
jgi:hypothetical protein